MSLNVEIELQQQVRGWLQSFPPDAPVVVVPVYNAYEDARECIDSLLQNTRAYTPLLILDDGSSDDRIARSLQPLAEQHGMLYVCKPANDGFVRTVNYAFNLCTGRDVVVVNSDVVVPAQWLERLQAAAYHRSNVATATPLTNHGTLVSVPYRNKSINALIDGMTLEEIDRRIQAASIRLRPIIPTAVGHCTYFRRSALDVIGYFDEAFSPGYGEEVDFSQRAVAAGFCHVAADDAFVFHKGSRSFGQESPAKQHLQSSHDQMIGKRYPWYWTWIDEAAHDLQSPLALALERASAAWLGYRIAIDATCVNGTTTGTQVGTLELIRALAASPARDTRLTIVIGDGVAREALLGVDRDVDEVMHISELKRQDLPVFDLIHRPFQVVSVSDLNMLQTVARRFIVSQLDCISYANPSYALGPEEWQRYRRQTEYVFAGADGIIFNSHDVARDAAHQGLSLPRERSCVGYVGVDHRLYTAARAEPPTHSEVLAERPFLLVIGTNFKHKNRAYAIRLLAALVARYGWPGQLVLAGPSVASGGSIAEEALAKSRHLEIQDRIHDIGTVSEAEKAWLLQCAALVLYPTLYEGFGIVPFEAAAAGTPALSPRLGSLNEVLGDAAIYLDTLDPERDAETVWAILSSSECAHRQVEAIRARAAMYTWEDVAGRTWDFYHRILAMPPRLQAIPPMPLSAARTGNRRGAITATESTAQAWRRRIALGVHVLRTKGPGALRKEVRQYIQWRLAQF